MKIKSLRHQLVSTTSIIIMTVIVVFSLILLLDESMQWMKI